MECVVLVVATGIYGDSDVLSGLKYWPLETLFKFDFPFNQVLVLAFLSLWPGFLNSEEPLSAHPPSHPL